MRYKYPVSKPYLKGNELEYVTEAINTEWISSQGPFIPEFEKAWAEWNDMKYGVACSSGTSALTLALRALGIGDGDEVIVPEFTMIASAWAVNYAGAKPVFVDCGDDMNIDVEKIERNINSKTKAIMPVHVYGRKCNMDKIMQIAHDYNLKIVEDSAEAHGVKPVGDIACYSLFANKIISAGEGGICLTNDDKLARQMQHLRSMAFSEGHTFLHKKFAYNFRMTNLQAGVAKAQVERVDEILEKRKEIERIYDEGLKNIEGITLMPKRDVLWMYDALADDRDGLMKFLHDNEIETRLFFKPMSQQPMYFDGNWEQLKAADFSKKGLYIPTYSDLSNEDQKFIINKIKEFYDGNNENSNSQDSILGGKEKNGRT
jgi:perosamine synthetase